MLVGFILVNKYKCTANTMDIKFNHISGLAMVLTQKKYVCVFYRFMSDD